MSESDRIEELIARVDALIEEVRAFQADIRAFIAESPRREDRAAS